MITIYAQLYYNPLYNDKEYPQGSRWQMFFVTKRYYDRCGDWGDYGKNYGKVERILDSHGFSVEAEAMASIEGVDHLEKQSEVRAFVRSLLEGTEVRVIFYDIGAGDVEDTETGNDCDGFESDSLYDDAGDEVEDDGYGTDDYNWESEYDEEDEEEDEEDEEE